MSVKLNLYNDIETILIAIDEIKTVGIFNNQFDREDEEKAKAYPCCFVEFANIGWTQTQQTPIRKVNAQKQQKAEGTIVTIHIGFEDLQDETANFKDIDPIIQKVYLALQDLTGDYYSVLNREAERQDTDHNNVIVWQMDFSTTMEEVGEEATLKKVDGGTLSLEITKNLKIDNDIIRTGKFD